MSTEPIVKYLTRCGFKPDLQRKILEAIDPRLFELSSEALIPVVDSMIDFANRLSEAAAGGHKVQLPPWGRATDKPLELRQVEALESIAEDLKTIQIQGIETKSFQ